MDDHIMKTRKEEGNLRVWTHKGLTCVAMRGFYLNLREDVELPKDKYSLFHLSGYVGLPKGKKNHGKDPDDIRVSIHGGPTYARDHLPGCEPAGDIWWVGFDCAHAGDICMDIPAINGFGASYKDMKYVIEQTNKLAEQLARRRK
jgi:hypothetical protein